MKCIYLMTWNQRQDNLYVTNLYLYSTYLWLIIYLKPIYSVGCKQIFIIFSVKWKLQWNVKLFWNRLQYEENSVHFETSLEASKTELVTHRVYRGYNFYSG